LWSDYNHTVITEMIADALTADRDAIVTASVERYVARIPGYRDADARVVADARRHTERHHDLLCEVLRRGRPPSAGEMRFVEEHAARRARQGIALADFLTAFRTYHTILWDAVRASGVAADEALAAAGTVIAYVDTVATLASSAYLEAQQLLLADSDRVRRDLLEDLLEVGSPRTAAGLAVAREAGLEPAARCLLVAAVAIEAPADAGALPRAAATMARALGGRRPPLAVTRHGEIVLVRVVEERPALRAPLVEACSRAAADGVTLAVGVSTVHGGVRALGAAYREASQALRRVAETGGGVLSLPDLSAFEYLTLRNDESARRLIAPEIEAFVADDREHGGLLIDTLLAYAEADLNAKAAAEALLIHPNTAHYRLARIAEKTGSDLRKLSDVIDLLIAIRLGER
jgi:PucR C-terminal helix-turn-helix domain/GGDEF-like domain